MKRMTKKEMISYLTNWGVYYENLLWDTCPLSIAELRKEVEWTMRIDAGDPSALYEEHFPC